MKYECIHLKELENRQYQCRITDRACVGTDKDFRTRDQSAGQFYSDRHARICPAYNLPEGLLDLLRKEYVKAATKTAIESFIGLSEKKDTALESICQDKAI